MVPTRESHCQADYYPASVFLECFAGSKLDLVLGHVLDDCSRQLLNRRRESWS